MARPIDRVIREELQAIGRKQGATPEQVQQKAAAWAAVFAAAKDPATPSTQMLGVDAKLPAGYWRDWLRRDPVAALHTLNVPVLVLRGQQDTTATHEDFERLRAGSSISGNAAREFPDLNGLFMQDAAPESGVVSTQMLDVLAEWLNRTGAPLAVRNAAGPAGS